MTQNRTALERYKAAQIPLHSEEIEQSVLGCILLDPAYSMPKVVEILTSDDFFDPRHRLIFSAMQSLDRDKKPIDAIMVYQELKESQSMVGATYISDLAGVVPSAQNILTYAEEVRDLSRKRALLSGIDDLKLSIDGGADIDAELDAFLKMASDMRKEQLKEIVLIGDVIEEVYDEMQTGRQVGIYTGYETMDRVTRGFQNQWLIVIAGASGDGKTTFALNVEVNMAKNGIHSLLFSAEMSVREIVRKMITAESEVESFLSKDDIKNSPDFEEGEADRKLAQRFNAVGQLSSLPIWLDDRPQNINTIYHRTKNMKYKLESEGKKLDIIFVDYLQLIQPQNKKDTREQEVGGVADGLKNIAKELNIPVVTMAQVNRDLMKDAKRKFYRNSDLRESSRIEHDADLILFLNPDKLDRDNYVLTAGKHRHLPYFQQNLTFMAKYSKFV